MKKIYFVSTGRCGTKRLAEILRKHLPEKEFSVQHQMDISRFANIAGNVMYYLGSWEWLKEKIHNHVLKKYTKGRHFITTDPLIAMTIPQKILEEDETCIIHIVRDKKEFAESFYRFTRKRIFSFIAHNFIPFWQIGIWPLENMFNNKMHRRYLRVWEKKNNFFKKKYRCYNSYEIITMNEVFKENAVKNIFSKIIGYKIDIPSKEYNVKSNQSSNL